jgi:hypothetical protein
MAPDATAPHIPGMRRRTTLEAVMPGKPAVGLFALALLLAAPAVAETDTLPPFGRPMPPSPDVAADAALAGGRDRVVLGLQTRHVQRLQQHLEETRVRVARGEATKTDLAQATARLANATAALAAARADLNQSLARYKRVVGEDYQPAPPQ